MVVRRNNGKLLIKSKYLKICGCIKYISRLYFPKKSRILDLGSILHISKIAKVRAGYILYLK